MTLQPLARHSWVALLALSILGVTACGGGGGDAAAPPGSASTLVVPKPVSCASGSEPESGLQGQVPAALRASSFKGFNCNLSLVGQLQGEGASWSAATFTDAAGHRCHYHSTAVPNADRVNPGVPVIDITNAQAPLRRTSLTSVAMLDPWESLRVNARRQILIADNGANGGGGPQIDIYDLSGDCRYPQLLSSTEVGTGADGGIAAPGIKGHEGAVSPDGRTYYVGDANAFKYYAIDITNTTKPRVIATYDMGAVGLHAHGLSVSQDGNRVYAVSPGNGAGQSISNPTAPLVNGFVVFDTSEVEARVPHPTMKVVSKTLFRDGSGAQHTIEMKVAGKPFMVMVDEGGSAGFADAQNNYIDKACAAGMSPFPSARIYDISDETRPAEISKLLLETHDCAHANEVKLDTVGLASFTYGSHYCSVDNRTNATAMACSYFNSGVRVFDIRDPRKPKEIAYFNPPSASKTAGSMHAANGQWRSGGPDWCSARLDFDYAKRQLVTSCQDNGMLVMQFATGTWPFADSTPAFE